MFQRYRANQGKLKFSDMSQGLLLINEGSSADSKCSKLVQMSWDLPSEPDADFSFPSHAA